MARMRTFRTSEPGEWEHFVAGSFYPLQLLSVEAPFTANARHIALSRGICIAEMSPAPACLTRSPRLVRQAPSDDALFLMQLGGEARIEQGDRKLHLTAGLATFCDPSEPYFLTENSGPQIVATIPRTQVLPPRHTLREARLKALHMGVAPLRVFRSLAEEISSDSSTAGFAELDGVSVAASDLLRCAATLALTAELDTRSWTSQTKLRGVQQYLLSRLQDSSLTMQQVADVNGLSPRRLTALFAPDDSPAAFLRRERLRRASEDLLSPFDAEVTVADIGARWGYPDPSTFGRAFRREYGQSPTDFRSSAAPVT